MRRVVFLVAACGSGSDPAKAPPPAPVAIAPRSLAPITGAHGGPIVTIAVTFDGNAAATADTTGGLRLWPTLDGAREPIVIDAPVPDALAIARDGSGFAIAVTDAASRVELVRVDAEGHVRARRRLGEAKQIEVAGDGLLALRADQAIEHIALDGTLRDRLLADAGTQIQELVVHGAIAKALVTDEKARRIVAIETAPALAWGARSPALALAELAPVVLGPDGEHVFAVSSKDGRITRFELATGKHEAVCAVPSTAPIRLRHRFRGLDSFGFVDPQAITMIGNKVACLVDNTFSWWNLDNGATTTVNITSGEPVFAAAKDRIVFGSDFQLAIHTDGESKYLGYGFRDLSHVRSVPTGLMIGKGDQEPVLLDDNFKERTRFALPKLRVDWTDLLPLDERYVLTSSTRPGTGDLWGNDYQIGIYDIVKQAMHHVLPHRARGGDLVYEPSTRILVASDKAKTLLLRFDPKTHTLGDEVEVALADPPKRIALLDPALSGGIIALVIRDEGDGGIEVFELHASDWPAAGERTGRARVIEPRRRYRHAGEVRAIDRAGRLYIYDLRYAETIGVYRGGANLAVLDGVQRAKLRPSPDGKHVILIEESKLTLISTDGKELWSVAAWGSSDVDWTPAGVLYARFPHALARIDVATGALVERQCGWGFGISATPRDTSTAAPSVCDVAP